MKIDSYFGKQRGIYLVATLSLLGLLPVSTSWAGAFIFAGKGNGVDVIAHPSGYTGSGGTVTVGICISPASANAAELEIPVQNVITVWNNLQAVEGNIEFGAIPNNAIDAESVLLHELGHCIGLAHVNLASESGLSGSSQNYTKSTDGADNTFNLNAGPDGIIGSFDDLRGDDVNLHWFNPYNDPFRLPIPIPVDASQYSRDVTQLPFGDSWVVNADRTVSTALGYLPSESVMQQGSYYGELQRELISDDVSTLLLAASGLDETAGSADDYQIALSYQGIATGSNCDITISIEGSSFAYCSVGGSWISRPHIRITSGSIYLGTGYNWFFNDQLLGNTNQPPLAVNDNASVDEDNSVAIAVLTNDSDPDNDALSIVGLGNPNHGTSTLNANNTVQYTPHADYNGTDSFSYTLTDGRGGNNSATVTVSINAVNDPPVANNDNATTGQDTAVNITVLANDSDVDGPSLGIIAVTQAGNGSVTHDNGSVTYMPNSGFAGSDSFSYTLSDGSLTDTAAVIVTVTQRNQAPTAAFTYQCTDLDCRFDASGSSDTDGTISSYSWAFGDGGNAGSMNPSHGYSSAGDYTVTLTVTDNDGAQHSQNALVTATAPPAAPDLTTADWATAQGSLSGTYTATHSADGISQTLLEAHSGGRPSSRSDGLDHIWQFNLSGGNHVFHLLARADFPAGDADSGFVFQWSTNPDGGWQAMGTVSSASITELSHDIGSALSGTVYVRVTDNDSSPGNTNYSSVHIDHMYFDGGAPATEPPAAASNPVPGNGATDVSVNTVLSWNMGVGADYHDVYFGTDADNLQQVSNDQSVNQFDPGALDARTVYYWRVDEQNSIGSTTGPVWSFITNASAGPAELLVAAVVLSTENASKGAKFGHTTVTVTDDFGNPASNVSVNGTFSGDFNEMVSATTDSNGVAILTTSGSVKGGVTFSFCVDSVSGSLPYRPGTVDCSSF